MRRRRKDRLTLKESKFERLRGRGQDLQAARITELLRPDVCRSRRQISCVDPFLLSESLVGHDQLRMLRLFCCCLEVLGTHQRERENICGRNSLEKCGFSSVCASCHS